MSRLEHAFREIDRVNREDPRTQSYENRPHPREWIFSKKVYEWVERLNPKAEEGVRLAARCHTLRRWEIPRSDFPMNTPGYHQWRRATARHSARAAADILTTAGYSKEEIDRVGLLITGDLFPRDPDARLLEDADCLAFLELKLGDYLAQWDEKKVRRILSGTWDKMSDAARDAAAGLSLDPRAADLIRSLSGKKRPPASEAGGS